MLAAVIQSQDEHSINSSSRLVGLPNVAETLTFRFAAVSALSETC
jgi:hypothetical protein